MTIFEKLIATLIIIASLNAVTFANFYHMKTQMPKNQYTNRFLTDVKKNDEKVLDYLFPSDDIDTEFSPPLNLSYTVAEFQKYKGTYLTSTAAVDNAYFDDTIFLGDSLTYGLQSKHISSDKVLAISGRGVYDILDLETTLLSGKPKAKIIDWLAQIKPKKLYINLGTNGVKFISNEKHIDYYKTMLNRIVAACPTTKIILVGISPWGEKQGGTSSDNGINKKINHFNTLLLELARSSNMLYLNACEPLINGRGALVTTYDSGDGLHWNSAAQTAYMNYLKTHAVKD